MQRISAHNLVRQFVPVNDGFREIRPPELFSLALYGFKALGVICHPFVDDILWRTFLVAGICLFS